MMTAPGMVIKVVMENGDLSQTEETSVESPINVSAESEESIVEEVGEVEEYSADVAEVNESIASL